MRSCQARLISFADQAVANLDWNQSPKDTLSGKYYYQHDPSIAPYAYSSVAGFSQHLDAGSQVASLTNTHSITPNLSMTEVIGILREKVYSTIAQPFTPQQLGINTFGSTFFPGITIVDPLGLANPIANPGNVTNLQFLTIGQGAASQGAFTGVFQNRIMPSANAIWIHGRHTFTFGGSYSYTQLNTRDRRTNQGIISTADFPSSFKDSSPPTMTSLRPSSSKATPTATTVRDRQELTSKTSFNCDRI